MATQAAQAVRVNLVSKVDHSYDIVIGRKLAAIGTDLVRAVPASAYVVITDSTVAKLHGANFLRSFKGAGKGSGKRVSSISFGAGERHKNRKTKELLENKILAAGADRQTVVIALGGGVVGDMAGFVAATMLRGVDYVQIPTTLLSQVDSSVGGKVAVDHPAGKNLIGAFHQPSRVYIDPAVLSTLPDNEFSNGMAEVIKHAVILDVALFAFLEINAKRIMRREPAILTEVIRRCCEIKARVVEKDENESGIRRILNFGHTVGHALESLFKFRIPHGRAVAIGMVVEAKISAVLGLIDYECIDRLRALLELYGLPSQLPRGTALKKLFALTSSDKKSKNGMIEYTLLHNIGEAVVGNPLPPKRALEALLRYNDFTSLVENYS